MDHLDNLYNYLKDKCSFKIYPSYRAISLKYNNIEYKFSIRYNKSRLHIQYIGLASSNSIRPYKHQKTLAEFDLQDNNYQIIYDYLIKTINNNRLY